MTNAVTEIARDQLHHYGYWVLTRYFGSWVLSPRSFTF